MTGLSAKVAYAVAVAGGAVLWVATTAATGRREAWDAPEYWTVTYPVAVVFAALLGFLAPVRPWRWALTLMLAQAVTLAATAASFGLLPLGLVMFAILAVPPMGVASLAGALGRRRLIK